MQQHTLKAPNILYMWCYKNIKNIFFSQNTSIMIFIVIFQNVYLLFYLQQSSFSFIAVKSDCLHLRSDCVLRLEQDCCILISASTFCILMDPHSYLGQSSADHWENSLQVLHLPGSLSNQFFAQNQWQGLRADILTSRQIQNGKHTNRRTWQLSIVKGFFHDRNFESS